MDDTTKIREQVRQQYAEVAKGELGCFPSCCGVSPGISKKLGYSEDDMGRVPEGANMGLGCGNPVAIAELKAGETVLDLGSGAGFDCFLAAEAVGESGRVIGVDMTHEMLIKARENAKKGEFSNVEFRLGEIEHLPLADDSVDVVISNCVVNLSPDKTQVFREVARVLKPGGRVMISDVVQLKPIPEALRSDAAAYAGCIAGAISPAELQSILEAVGLEDASVEVHASSAAFIDDWAPGMEASSYIASATVHARAAGGPCCDEPRPERTKAVTNAGAKVASDNKSKQSTPRDAETPESKAGTRAARSCCPPSCCT